MRTTNKLQDIIKSVDDLPLGIYEINIWYDEIFYKRITLHSGIINISKLVNDIFIEEIVNISDLTSNIQFLLYNDLYNIYV